MLLNNPPTSLLGWSLAYANVYMLAILPAIKDAGLRIGVQRTLHEEFLEVCRAEEKTAVQGIRELMCNYVNKCKQAKASGAVSDAHRRWRFVEED